MTINQPLALTNPYTGEVYGSSENGGTFTSEEEKRQRREFLESKKDQVKIKKSFVKVYDEGVSLLYDKLTGGETKFLIMKILPFICYDDCILRVGGDKRGEIISVSRLAELTESNLQTTKNMISKFKKLEILGQHSTGEAIKCITINPYIFMRGTTVNESIAGMFEDTVWAKMDSYK